MKAILKIKAAGGAQSLVVTLAMQTAAVRSNAPDAPTTVGNTTRTGNGECVTASEDISATTATKQFVRFGVAYKASSAGEAWGTASLQVCMETYGKVVSTRTLQLVAPDTSSYYPPLTGWLPSPMVAKAKAAIVLTQATGTFKVGLACQVANTSVEVPESWSDLGTLYASGENNTGEQTITYSATPEAWVRLGLRYTNDTSGTNGQGVVTAAVSVRRS